MDLIETYFPDITQITDTQALAARERLVTYWQRGWPDLDMRPGSPFGDGVVTPLAYYLAASETALDRFRSDLDLEQVAKGTIYDCDFVAKYLNNFAVFPREGLKATGIVRFIFSADVDIEIDRGIKIQFANSTENIFYPRLFEPGPVLVKKVGTPLEAGSNVFPLVYLSETQFAADIPVYGQMAVQIEAGDVGALNTTIDNLTEVQAIVDFDEGTAPASLSQLAAKTRETFYSASMNQRGSAARFLAKEYPDVEIGSPVLPGDFEMMRGSVNPLGFSARVMDVYVRSEHFQRSESHTIRLPYVAEQNGESVDSFIGKISLVGIPMSIDSITSVDSPDVNLDDGNGSQLILSRSKNPERAPMLCAAYTELEELWLVIKMPRAESGAQLIVPNVATDDSQYADFTISYRTDPLIPGISSYLSSTDVKPAGVDPLVRGLLPINLKSLTVRYTRDSGTNVQLENAREEIYNYLFSNGYPDRYTDARIVDSMYFAGAKTTVGVDCVGEVAWSVADRVMPPSAPLPDTDLAGCLAAAKTPPAMPVATSADFNPAFRDPFVGTADATFVAAGFRNVGVMIARENIQFKEEQ